MIPLAAGALRRALLLALLLPACGREEEHEEETPSCPEPAPTPAPPDLNGDGWPDLAFAQTEDASGSYLSSSPVFWGDAGGLATDRADAYDTIGADDVAIADLDGDGHPELIFASVSDGEARAVDSLVYAGGPDGPSSADPLRLPGVGASAVTVHDVNQDGHPDLFLSNRYDGSSFSESAYTLHSTLYLGGEGGLSADRSQSVETLGAADAAFDDLDQDGWVDLVVASGTLFAQESTVFRGGPDGFSPALTLPTAAPEGLALADWNGDGWTDLFFANFYETLVLDIDSPLYWGGPGGFSAEDASWIPTHGATDALAADLDGDGCQELVVANAMTGNIAEMNFEVDSEVWRGSPEGPSERMASLPTVSAAAVSAGDLDADGDLDLVFANRYAPDGSPEGSSVIYWNDDGFDPADRLELPTVGAAGVSARVE